MSRESEVATPIGVVDHELRPCRQKMRNFSPSARQLSGGCSAVDALDHQDLVVSRWHRLPFVFRRALAAREIELRGADLLPASKADRCSLNNLRSMALMASSHRRRLHAWACSRDRR